MAELWRWLESKWINPDIDWHKGKIITTGVDVGSVSSQAVIMVDGELYACSNMRTGSSSEDSAWKVINWILEDSDMRVEDSRYCIGTGYGRVNVPMANRVITEIACHARGANWMYGPSVRTVLDMGGQDCKIMRCDEKGKVLNFAMNDKCAAGAGRGLEVFAEFVDVNINEMGDRSFDIDEEPSPVASTCVIFAKSEAAGLLRKGWAVEKVIAAYCSATVGRVMGLMETVGVEPDLGITGGIAKNRGVKERLEGALGRKFFEPKYDTQIAGAIGGALFGQALVGKGKA